MRTITRTVYSFNELTDAAKERALSDYNTSGQEYAFAGEALESIKALASHFDGDVRRYAIDWTGTFPSQMAFTMPEMNRREIHQRLRALGSYNKETLRGLGDCKLTGYCADEDAIDGFRMAFMAGESDLEALMNAAFDTWLKAAQSDAQHQFSMEGYAEHCAGNDYEFYKNGDLL